MATLTKPATGNTYGGSKALPTQYSYDSKTGKSTPTGYVYSESSSSGSGGGSSKSTTTITKQGSSGSSVTDLQTQLKNAGYNITVDGIFGPQTKSAVMKYQQANGLTVDGIVGPQTIASFSKSPSSGKISSPSVSKTYTSADGTQTFNTKAEADQYNTTLNKFTNIETPKTTEITTINDKANKEAELTATELAKKSLENIDTSASSKLIASLLGGDIIKTPSPINLEEKQAQLRAKYAVEPLEANLASTDAEIARLKSEFKTLSDTETNRQVSMIQINRRKSQEQIQYEDQMGRLVDTRNSIANELKTKYDVINTAMQYAEKDYDNAQQDYTTKFNRAISMINLIKGVENEEKSDKEKLIDNSKANLQLMLTYLKDKQWSTVDTSTKASINKMELQAGLPVGTFEGLLNATDEPIVSFGSQYTDNKGNITVPVYTKNPSTGALTVYTKIIGTDSKITKKDQELATDIGTALTDFRKQMTEKGWRGITPSMYDYYRSQILKQYGSSGVTKFDAAIKDANMAIDYGDSNFKLPNDKKTSSGSSSNTIEP